MGLNNNSCQSFFVFFRVPKFRGLTTRLSDMVLKTKICLQNDIETAYDFCIACTSISTMFASLVQTLRHLLKLSFQYSLRFH